MWLCWIIGHNFIDWGDNYVQKYDHCLRCGKRPNNLKEDNQ